MRIVAVLVGLLLLAGCGALGPRTAPRPGPAVYVEPSWPPGDVGGVAAERGSIPDDFRTVWVLRCRTGDRVEPGGRRMALRIAERVDAPAAELVRRLREPSDPPPAAGVNCPAVLRLPPYFVLVDESGRGLLPAVPTDQCGLPRDEATAPLDDLPWRTVSTVGTGQPRSETSARTGCSDG